MALSNGNARIAGAPAATVSASENQYGKSHTCAVLSDGGVMCWGYNDVGQLGIGNTSTMLYPSKVQLGRYMADVLRVRDLSQCSNSPCCLAFWLSFLVFPLNNLKDSLNLSARRASCSRCRCRISPYVCFADQWRCCLLGVKYQRATGRRKRERPAGAWSCDISWPRHAVQYLLVAHPYIPQGNA